MNSTQINFETKIPGSIFITVILIFFIFSPFPSFSDDGNIFYLRSDMKTSNGEIIETNLLMTPAQEEFRIKEFKLYKVTGFSYSNSKPDTVSAAKHSALNNLLLSEGIKSLKSKSLSRNSIHHEESVLSYEGFIKTPYKILKQGYNKENTIYTIEIEVLMAPVAYPSEWSYYYLKKKLYNTLHNMLSVFM